MRLQVKYNVIYQHREQYPISSMCRFFDVSRSEYYGYVQRIDIVQKIKECQDKCDRTYGYHRVHIWLERQGIHRNPKTVLRVIFKDFIGCSSSGLSRAEPPQSVRESYTPPHNPDVDISCRA